MNELGTEMESRYSTAKICSFEDANQENCEPILALEPGKIEILTASTIENNALVLPHFTSTEKFQRHYSYLMPKLFLKYMPRCANPRNSTILHFYVIKIDL